MTRQMFDTSKLISFWHHRRGQLSGSPDEETIRRWAHDLIDLYATNKIASPVEIEFLAGARNSRELHDFQAFLAEFELIDRDGASAEDWKVARQLAVRIPADGRPRQLGDCLIGAIARRLRLFVVTSDTGFPR